MTDYQQANEPSGIRLMRLMDTRLLEIVRKEHSSEKHIHLYGTGEYWVAFEQSAYLLYRISSESIVSVVKHAAYPFPVVMASIPDEELQAYAKRHILKRDEADYKELIAPDVPAEQYRTWHRQEVLELM